MPYGTAASFGIQNEDTHTNYASLQIQENFIDGVDSVPYGFFGSYEPSASEALTEPLTLLGISEFNRRDKPARLGSQLG